jgi:hypothetical protein
MVRYLLIGAASIVALLVLALSTGVGREAAVQVSSSPAKISKQQALDECNAQLNNNPDKGWMMDLCMRGKGFEGN